MFHYFPRLYLHIPVQSHGELDSSCMENMAGKHAIQASSLQGKHRQTQAFLVATQGLKFTWFASLNFWTHRGKPCEHKENKRTCKCHTHTHNVTHQVCLQPVILKTRRRLWNISERADLNERVYWSINNLRSFLNLRTCHDSLLRTSLSRSRRSRWFYSILCTLLCLWFVI